tara:strand:- start:941 stop:1312 length:372 start_codon:yes stop_codon:yes gene_type:complete
MDNNQRGTFAEYLFATKCLEKGYNVSFPLMDSSVYDCIIDTGERLIKVQVKSTSKSPQKNRNTIQAHLENSKSTYSKNLVDYFAVYVNYYDGFFIFKNTGNMQTIRLSLIGKNKIFFNNFAFI